MHLPGLNGIRAIAAMIVLVFHMDQFFPKYGIPSLGYYATYMSEFGVTMFFVLSGFLITYLLLNEKKESGTIAIKKFYIRRILRIWPIYYLIIVLTLSLFYFIPSIEPPVQIGQSISLYIFFIANVAYSLKLTFTTLTPLWSVGTEEQFYAFWPLLLKKSRNVLTSLAAVIIIYLSFKLFALIYNHQTLLHLIEHTRVDCMAIGGIGAYLLFKKSALLVVFLNPVVEITTWLIILYSCLFKPIHISSFLDHEIYSFVFLSAILNVSSNPKKLINLENKFFDFLGRISYGIYVYHMLIICLLSTCLKSYFKNDTFSYLVVYILTVGLTVFVAYISYQIFERKFIRKKEKYAVIKSKSSIYFS